jgi:hypothetical protein
MSLGCDTQERRAWKEGYNENYRAAYQEGWQAGEVKGRADGQERGTAAAEWAARAGSDWRFYSTEALCGFVFGFVVGLLAQYSVLIGCGQSGRLPQFLTVAFVPCMKRSLAYAVFERRRALMMDLAETLRQVRAKNKVELAKIQAVRDNVARRLKAIGSIEELNAAHLVELARKEISQIIGASEEEANRAETISQPRPEPRFTYYCPICWTAVRYDEELVHKTVQCPNSDCCRPLTLPPPLRTAEEAQAIRFAHGD